MDLKELQKFFKPKGVLGKGVCFSENKLRLATCVAQGDKIRVLSLKEAALPEKPDQVLEFLIQLGLKSGSEVGITFRHPQLKIKKVLVPAASGKGLMQAVRWQLYSESKDSAAKAQVCFHPLGMSAAGKGMEYWAYGLPQEDVMQIRQKAEALQLKAVAAEPLPLTLVAWSELLYPEQKKNVGLLYFSGKRGDFVGMKEGAFLHTAFFEQEASEEVALGTNDLGLRFQSLIDEFLLKADLQQLDEIYLAGEWEEEASTQLSSLYALPCKKMGEGSEQVLFMEEEQKIAYRFAAELGMALFPRSEV